MDASYDGRQVVGIDLHRRRRAHKKRPGVVKPQVRTGAPPGTRTPNPRIKSPLLHSILLFELMSNNARADPLPAPMPMSA